MRIAQWITTGLAIAGAVFCLIVHALTYMGTTLFRAPGKDVPQPFLLTFSVLAAVISVLCQLAMPAPWERPRLIGPPRRINYVMMVSGLVGAAAALLCVAGANRQAILEPVLLHGGDTAEVVMRNGDRHFISEAEYTRLQDRRDHLMGDLFYRGMTAGLACLLIGTAGYGAWYIARQPILRKPTQDPYGFGLG